MDDSVPARIVRESSVIRGHLSVKDGWHRPFEKSGVSFCKIHHLKAAIAALQKNNLGLTAADFKNCQWTHCILTNWPETIGRQGLKQ